MNLFDSHCHPYLSKEKQESEILHTIDSTKNPLYITSVWVDIPSSLHNQKLAQQFPFVIASAGIHPCHSLHYSDTRESTLQELESIIKAWNILAIGECWLDYYRLPPHLEQTERTKNEIIEIQKEFFSKQIELAKKYNFPLIIHNRESKDDILGILKEHDVKNFVFHCYSEDLWFAREILSYAPKAMISFSWIVTFNSAQNVQETAKNIPLENIMIETDSPYLAPTPYRWQENYSRYLQKILEKIQFLRKEPPQDIEEIIFQNSLRFFGLIEKKKS